MSNLGYATPAMMREWAEGIMQRQPDFVIGPAANPYLRRWWVIPRNEGCNAYLHEILRSDDDRAGHDHPWDNTSYIITGGYDEMVFDEVQPWRVTETVTRRVGDWVSRKASHTHRLIVPEGGSCVSLFLTGPRVRDWGFWCPEGKGFVPWREFTAGDNGELVGRGCGEI